MAEGRDAARPAAEASLPSLSKRRSCRTVESPQCLRPLLDEDEDDDEREELEPPDREDEPRL